jgi:hypothetical protein
MARDKASALGLVFRRQVVIDSTQVVPLVNDSYAEFAGGFYRLFFGPFYRPVGAPPEKGSVATTNRINETIDGSVFERWRVDANYRPQNLVDWAKRMSVEPSSLTKAVMAVDPKIEVP